MTFAITNTRACQAMDARLLLGLKLRYGVRRGAGGACQRADEARPGVVERKMFGGLGWMVGGNMAVGVMRADQLMVRIEPEESEAAIREPHVHRFGRPGATR